MFAPAGAARGAETAPLVITPEKEGGAAVVKGDAPVATAVAAAKGADAAAAPAAAAAKKDEPAKKDDKVLYEAIYRYSAALCWTVPGLLGHRWESRNLPAKVMYISYITAGFLRCSV